MYSNGSFHMPPPPPSAQHQAYNPKMHAHIAAGATLTLPPPPPQPSEQMSATYIPHGDTYGESVGIPAFDDAVERGINNSSPLPKKKDGTVERTLEVSILMKELD